MPWLYSGRDGERVLTDSGLEGRMRDIKLGAGQDVGEDSEAYVPALRQGTGSLRDFYPTDSHSLAPPVVVRLI